MTAITTVQRLQKDIENICEMAKDDIDAALWHFTRSPTLAASELRSAIHNLDIALGLIEGS
jgi:hypothetical protein